MAYPYRETPYPYFWGPPTAAENWCEEDYIVSPYIAEFVNTITNIVYITLAFNGLFFSHTRGGNKKHSSRSLPHLGLFSVGIGSGIYHASLREWPQLCGGGIADSLSMILATAFVLQRLITFGVSAREGVVKTVILWNAVAGFGVLHCRINNLNVHSAVFAAMILYIGYRTRGITKSVKDPEKKERAGRLARWGSVCAVTGFALWGADSIACGQLRWARRQIGMPFGFVLEFHGWWHILTAVSAHLFMILLDELLLDAPPSDKHK